MSDRFDLVILGSGSTAFAAALTAQELQKTAVMTEERPIGGTCVNRGCLPSKNLIGAAKIIHDARNPRYPGLNACAMDLDFGALVEQKDAVVHDYRKKKYESLVSDHVRVESGHVRFLDPHTVEVDGKQLAAEKVLIAAGSRPVLPDIDGLDRVPYLTSDLLTVDEQLELRELPQSLLIVGGGYIALELGQMFSRFGSTVTILERNTQLLAHGYEPEVGRTIAAIFAEEGIQIAFNAMAKAVRQEGSEVVATALVAGRERQYRNGCSRQGRAGRSNHRREHRRSAGDQHALIRSPILRSAQGPHPHHAIGHAAERARGQCRARGEQHARLDRCDPARSRRGR